MLFEVCYTGTVKIIRVMTTVIVVSEGVTCPSQSFPRGIIICYKGGRRIMNVPRVYLDSIARSCVITKIA